VPSIDDGDDDEQPNGTPGDNWGIGRPIVNELDGFMAPRAKSSLPLCDFSLRIALAFH
jgi:hypothetical protein